MYLALLSFILGAAALQALPPLPQDKLQMTSNGSSRGLVLKDLSTSIYITHGLASKRDSEGLTLIPPSGQEYAQTFLEDLEKLTQRNWSLKVVESISKNVSGIFLDIEDAMTKSFSYENGILTEEGYTLQISEGNAVITGSGSRGMWWGTRTLLQQMLLSNWTSIPAMTVSDAPAYSTRGYMLDAGRKWYSPSFLKELCTYSSFFKMSEFHYHTSDNYPLNRGHNETWSEVYSQFSLHPENPELHGIIQRPDQTLSRADYEDLEKHCANRGITVIPEIEAPGHCLTITKWKPELALAKKDLLNLTHPESIPTVQTIWAEFLPWFHTKEVHIGADEYSAALADDYVNFVNEMAEFVKSTSGKRIRIWGTDEPSNITISKEIIIQHWQYGQSDPVLLQDEGYEIVNSQDWWAYMSLKNDHAPINPAPYAQFFNESRILNFANEPGWQWQPAFFNQVNTTEQLANGASANKGAIMAAWNDNGPDASTQLEAYYAMRRGIPLVAARAWSGARGLELDASTIDDSIDFLTSHNPGQNLDRKTNFVSWTRGSESDPVTLGHGSKGMNYSLTISATGPFNLSSDDVVLSLYGNGSLTFSADGFEYPLQSVDENDGYDVGHPGRIWVNQTSSSHDAVVVPIPAEIKITGDVIGGSRVWINGTFVGRFEVYVFGGRNTMFSWSQMAFVAPLETVTGGIQTITLGVADVGNGTMVLPTQSLGGRTYENSLGISSFITLLSVVGYLVIFG